MHDYSPIEVAGWRGGTTGFGWGLGAGFFMASSGSRDAGPKGPVTGKPGFQQISRGGVAASTVPWEMMVTTPSFSVLIRDLTFGVA